jgi:hypothetical protein
MIFPRLTAAPILPHQCINHNLSSLQHHLCNECSGITRYYLRIPVNPPGRALRLGGTRPPIDINCFIKDPSIKSSLKFLRKTPWAREQVEKLYLETRFTT